VSVTVWLIGLVALVVFLHIFYYFTFCIFGSYSFLPAILLFYGTLFNRVVAFLVTVKKNDDNDIWSNGASFPVRLLVT